MSLYTESVFIKWQMVAITIITKDVSIRAQTVDGPALLQVSIPTARMRRQPPRLPRSRDGRPRPVRPVSLLLHDWLAPQRAQALLPLLNAANV